MPEPKYAKPTALVNAEARAKNGNSDGARVLSTSDSYDAKDPQADEPGFIGTDPIYQHPANHTESPLQAERGFESKIENAVLDEDAQVTELETSDSADEEEKKEESAKPSTPSTSSDGKPAGVK